MVVSGKCASVNLSYKVVNLSFAMTEENVPPHQNMELSLGWIKVTLQYSSVTSSFILN